MMRRREFIAGLGGTMAAWPVAVRAQQAGKLPTIGYLGGAAGAAVNGSFTAAFLERLHELGWIEGRNIAIQYRASDGSAESAAEIATEIVRLKVDVIVAPGAIFALAAKRATSVIPIVFPVAGNPVELGLVASLARPGGNATGLTNQLTDLARKRVERLREVVPGLRRLAIMVYVGTPLSELDFGEVQMAADKLGLELITVKIKQTEDIALAFDGLRDRADALYVANSAFLANNQMRINILALGARLPTMFGERRWVETGGLMSYGANLPDQFRRAGDYVDKILRGTKPADIPVEQPTRFDLVVNLITARALGLTIPESLLATADEVIQ
jgi:putative ABC transport system substrate-binding protein